jgi:hypothetical protein
MSLFFWPLSALQVVGGEISELEEKNGSRK